MPPKAAQNDADASKALATRPAQEDAAKVTKPGKGSGKRGRPKMDPALRKTQVYVPTGRPRGRPPKDPSQKKAPAAPKTAAAPAAPGAARGRGRPPGSTKKAAAAVASTSVAAAVASVTAAVSAARTSAAAAAGAKVPGKRGRKSKATLEAERLAREAALVEAGGGGDNGADDAAEH